MPWCPAPPDVTSETVLDAAPLLLSSSCDDCKVNEISFVGRVSFAKERTNEDQVERGRGLKASPTTSYTAVRPPFTGYHATS